MTVAGRTSVLSSVADVRWRTEQGRSVPGTANRRAITDRLSSGQSLFWHEQRSALVLDHEHQEFRRLGTACVPVNDMDIVRAFMERLSWCQCYLLSPLHLLHNGALQDVSKRMCIVSVDSGRPAGRMLYCDHRNFSTGTLRKIF